MEYPFLDMRPSAKAGGLPMLGMNTSDDPMSLPPGVWSLRQNIRTRDNVPKARGGMTASLSSDMSGGSCRGYFQGLFGQTSVSTMFVAMRVGSETLVYTSTNGTTWAEITAASGKYGNTRFSTDGLVSFAIVPDMQTNWPRTLVMSNGVDSVRVYNSAAGKTETISSIEAMEGVRNTPVQMRIPNYFKINNSSETSITASNASFACADTTLDGGNAAVDNVLRFTVDTSAIVGTTPNVLVTFSTAWAGNQTANNQVIVGLDTDIPDFWSFFTLKIGTSGGETLLWDPNDSDYPKPVPIGFDLSQRSLWLFDAGAIYGDGNAWSTSSIDRFRITYSPASTSVQPPAGDPTFDIFLFCSGCDIPGDTKFGVTYRTANYNESAIVLYSKYETQKLKHIGAPTVEIGGASMPLVPEILYQANVPWQNTASAGLTNVEYRDIYVKRNDDFMYRRLDTEQIADYDVTSPGAWAFKNATPTPPAFYTDIDTYSGVGTVAENVTAPGTLHRSAPIGKGLTFANGRLFAGSNISGMNGIAFSEYKFPLRFRFTPEIVAGDFPAESPGVISLTGEVAQAIVPVSASVSGTSTLIAVTDRGVYAFGGLNAAELMQAGRVSGFGTVSPNSVAELNGKVFYLDTENQIRLIYGGDRGSIARGIIDDQFAGIPGAYKKFVSATVFDDRVYFAFTPTGATTNTKIAVWDDIKGYWDSIDVPPVACQGLMSWWDGTNVKKRLIAIGSDGKAYEYDLSTQTQDLGTTNITVVLTSWETPAMNGKSVYIDRVGIMMDAIASATGTITRSYKMASSTGTSTISLADASSVIMRYDGAQAESDNAFGRSCKLSLSLPMTAGAKIYRISAELRDRDDNYDVA